MSHHGREYEVDNSWQTTPAQDQLVSAVALIKAIAEGPTVLHGNQSTCARCDIWLYQNGFECAATRRRDRERRAEELDREIERLRAERQKLA